MMIRFISGLLAGSAATLVIQKIVKERRESRDERIMLKHFRRLEKTAGDQSYFLALEGKKT
jgi:hypothetical protein